MSEISTRTENFMDQHFLSGLTHFPFQRWKWGGLVKKTSCSNFSMTSYKSYSHWINIWIISVCRQWRRTLPADSTTISETNWALKKIRTVATTSTRGALFCMACSSRDPGSLDSRWKIPSEIGVALRYTLFNAYTVYTVNTVYTVYSIETAYTAETVACMPTN